jgi:protein-S-isoprenylcysteine O-methyltransferase Ste14
MVASLFAKNAFLASVAVIKPLGFAIFALGMLLFALAAGFLKKAFQGNVEPVTDALVTTGPYKTVRHPLYLGMVVSAFGITLGLKSLWGLLLTLFVFLPLGVHRAQLEEKALAREFGPTWEAYARRTGFMLPRM